MTICVSVKVGEGLVLAADSKVVLEGIVQSPQGVQQKTILQHFDYANKVTHFKDYPIGVLNWGLASINNRTIQSLIMEFEYNYPPIVDKADYTVKEIAGQLIEFIKVKYELAFHDVNARPSLGLLIGGYSSNTFFGEKYSYEFPHSADLADLRPDNPDGTPNFGANWFGMTDALQRLVLGFDSQALQELVNRGVDPTLIQGWISDGVPSLPLVFDGMPVQDAIDFAEYAIQVVIGRFRFGIGIPLCGGEIDIAVITPNTFRWAKRKQWGMHHD